MAIFYHLNKMVLLLLLVNNLMVVVNMDQEKYNLLKIYLLLYKYIKLAIDLKILDIKLEILLEI
jgi:hypothetical protein